jgi:predicted HicB family RNase H-like nuclease
MRHKKTAQITFRIDPNLKEAAEKAAAQDRRSLTSLIERVLAKPLGQL